PDQISWLNRLESEHQNLRSALQWLLDTDPNLAIRLAGSLWLFWYTHGHLREGRSWLERCVAASSVDVDSAKAKALNGAGWMALHQDCLDEAQELIENALVLYRELEDADGIASCLSNLGFVTVFKQMSP